MSGAAASCGGGTKVIIGLTDLGDLDVFPGTAACGVTWNSDGTITLEGGLSNSSATWAGFTLVGIGDLYQIRVTKNSGDDPTTHPGLSTWLALSSSRQWRWAQTVVGEKAANIGVEIALVSDETVIIASNNDIDVLADVESPA